MGAQRRAARIGSALFRASWRSGYGWPLSSILAALREYSGAVQARTRDIVGQLRMGDLDELMDPERLRVVYYDEGLAHSRPEPFLDTISGWTKGMCLMNYGLTHPYQHVGEIGVIAGLLGVEF